ncbi:MAG: hypothetical protein M3T56_09620 [Chloroflexota bacterium]|nr:hypothetical protein [Chloroflexota bacterium]
MRQIDAARGPDALPLAWMLVRDECALLPRGDDRQNELRMTYAIIRQHQLARSSTAPAAGALLEAIASVRSRHHGFRPMYDIVYFDSLSDASESADA